MNEPDNLSMVLVGNLTDNEPWDIELWARDDANVGSSTARWWRAGMGPDHDEVQRMSWDRLQEHARDRGCGATLTVLEGSPNVR